MFSIEIVVYNHVRRVVKGVQVVNINQWDLGFNRAHILLCDKITVQNHTGRLVLPQQ